MEKKHKKKRRFNPIHALSQEIHAIFSESVTQFKKDSRFLASLLFRRKKRQIRLIKKEQVIFGNWITSSKTYKKYKILVKKYLLFKTEFQINLIIFIHKIVVLLRAVILRATYFAFGIIFISMLFFLWQANVFIQNLPNPKMLTTRASATTTKIFDRNGILLYEIYSEQNRTPVLLSQIPLQMKQATIAIEDKYFYSHEGISPNGIIRALFHNVQSDQKEGGSTITQQLVRSAFLTPDKTIRRKLLEMFLAYWTEKVYSKDQILEMYLNQVPYGGTAWGIEAASQTYFGKSVRDLTLAQSALLAGLPAAPTLYSPFGAHPQYAKNRQLQVLDQMEANGFISKNLSDKTKQEDLKLVQPRISLSAPHFVMYVKELLDTYYGEKVVATEGLRVYTTLNLSLQEKVQNIVSNQIQNLQKLSVSNGAALVTDPKTGEILAMVGSKDYFDTTVDGQVNVTTSLRPPGSSIKVVTYAAALQRGYTAHSTISDTPISFFDGVNTYSPKNYDGVFHGNVTLRTALASSYNIPAVKVLASIGLPAMIDQAQKMGITTWQKTDAFGLSLTLGAGEVTMLDMAKVYATLANAGTRVDLIPFTKIENAKGETLALPLNKNTVQEIPPEVAFILSDILSDNNARTPAFGRNSSLLIPGKTVAVKTGTSDNKRDNWTIGYTPDYVTAVWVGNNDNSPMNPALTSGVTGAAPIWHDIMNTILKDTNNIPFSPPPGIITLRCSGKDEYFINNSQNVPGCSSK
jgi:1A family penicillin-binding protein